ncbi:MAG: ABC transporter permease [Streptosporangiaceae bacterium]|nr:ABC transporter permease [Streptosporangiaceae bacterium]
MIRSRRLYAGAGIVAFFTLMAIFGPFLTPDAGAFSRLEWKPPSGAHWLGTTSLGQDVLAQIVSSARATLEIGAGAGLVATIIAIAIGIGGGYAGGVVDEGLSLLSNVVLVIPALPLIIVIATFVHASGVWPTVLVISFVSWAASARVLRAQTLSIRNRDYVLAARAGGERAWRIVLSEILPNELALIIAQLTYSMIFAILTLVILDFLGLASSGQPTWGTMLYYAQTSEALSSGAWWWFVPPGLCIALFGMGLALINFSMDEILNPRLRVYKETS